MLQSTEADRFIDIFTNWWHSLVESWIGVAARTRDFDYIAQTATTLLDQWEASDRHNERMGDVPWKRRLTFGIRSEQPISAPTTRFILGYRKAIGISFAEKVAIGVNNRGMVSWICLFLIVHES